MSQPKAFYEHFNNVVNDLNYQELIDYEYFFVKKRTNEKSKCVGIYIKPDGCHVQLSYFIGLDWISKEQTIYVAPKLNQTQITTAEGERQNIQTDYLRMLFTALKHSEIRDYTDDLFEIKFDNPLIEIQQQKDFLTPLLIVQFLFIVKEIVRKGLKKSYYKIEQNLYGKIKGRVLIGKTIKQNTFKNKQLYTYCNYDEFGLDSLENRLIKKALTFVQRYLPAIKIPNAHEYTSDILNYITPAFQDISEDVKLFEVQQTFVNQFYKEYNIAIKLAKLILQRFGYNINATQSNNIKTPPFWIDMSKLFELYIIGLLKEKYEQIEYQFNATYGYPDFLIVDRGLILDAKYKTYYKENFTGMEQWKRDSIASDIRQLSGYARDKKVFEKLKAQSNQIIDCIIFYPDQLDGLENLTENELNSKEYEYSSFINFYAVPIKLPTLKATPN